MRFIISISTGELERLLIKLIFLFYLPLVYRFGWYHAIRKATQTKKGLDLLAPQDRFTLIVREWRTYLCPANHK